MLTEAQYLIQADFILVANREAIERYAQWNLHLRQSIIEAFRAAVSRLVSIRGPEPKSGLRYAWHAFLAYSGGSTVNFWSVLRNDILQDFRTECILESRNESFGLRYPTSLVYIPPSFRLSGEPLVEDEMTKNVHLSFHYDSESSKMPRELGLIGVKEMSVDIFFAEFKLLISRRVTHSSRASQQNGMPQLRTFFAARSVQSGSGIFLSYLCVVVHGSLRPRNICSSAPKSALSRYHTGST